MGNFVEGEQKKAIAYIDTLIYDEYGNQAITPKGRVSVDHLTSTIIKNTIKEIRKRAPHTSNRAKMEEVLNRLSEEV